MNNDFKKFILKTRADLEAYFSVLNYYKEIGYKRTKSNFKHRKKILSNKINEELLEKSLYSELQLKDFIKEENIPAFAFIEFDFPPLDAHSKFWYPNKSEKTKTELLDFLSELLTDLRPPEMFWILYGNIIYYYLGNLNRADEFNKLYLRASKNRLNRLLGEHTGRFIISLDEFICECNFFELLREVEQIAIKARDNKKSGNELLNSLYSLDSLTNPEHWSKKKYAFVIWFIISKYGFYTENFNSFYRKF